MLLVMQIKILKALLTAVLFQLTAPQSLVPVYRISTLYGEYFRYDAADLRKVDVERSTVLLTVCGRNRVTTGGQPIACLSLPLAGYAQMTTAEWYPLKYQILLPSGYDVAEDMQSMRGSNSWEEKGTCKECSGVTMLKNGGFKIFSFCLEFISIKNALNNY